MPTKKKPVTSSKRLNMLLETMERLHHIKDLQTLLDTLLYESRRFTGADAGSIYLVDGDKLKFSYVQNDTIFKNDLLCNKYIYSNQELPINKKSVAGYVAQTGKPLLIKDAYKIEAKAPYSFNRYFDEISAYRTQSMLIVPLKTSRGDVIGVLQLINSKTRAGKVVAFSDEFKLFVSQFTFQAAVAIERALTLRELVLRMVRLAEMRDPEETQRHLYRVSSYAAEIYRKWADNHNVPKTEVTNYRDIFSVAAMLHDIGKVGIPDNILRKKGKLTEEEYRVIQLHTIFGEKLFQTANSELERMAHELILNHHEKWDGSGYPGSYERGREPVVFGPGKRGGEIPLSARIIALADVYDALINKRVYKDAWEEDAVLYYIKQQSGKHFDPEIVTIFFDIYDVIKAIRAKWS